MIIGYYREKARRRGEKQTLLGKRIPNFFFGCENFPLTLVKAGCYNQIAFSFFAPAFLFLLPSLRKKAGVFLIDYFLFTLLKRKSRPKFNRK